MCVCVEKTISVLYLTEWHDNANGCCKSLEGDSQARMISGVEIANRPAEEGVIRQRSDCTDDGTRSQISVGIKDL